jgi:hypothetical protein
MAKVDPGQWFLNWIVYKSWGDLLNSLFSSSSPGILSTAAQRHSLGGGLQLLTSFPGDAHAGGPKFDLDLGRLGHDLCDVQTVPF